MRRCALTLVVPLALAAGCGGGRDGERPPPIAARADPPPISAARARQLGLTRRLPAAYRRVCARQAAYAPAGARVCPPLVPRGRLKLVWTGPWSRVARFSGGYAADFESRSLGPHPRDPHPPVPPGHWRYDVSWTPLVRRFQVDRGVERPANSDEVSACRRDRIGRDRIEVCRVVPWEKGGGVNGGHVAVLWRHGPVTYNISLHRYANERRARVMMAALIAAVRRSGRRFSGAA